MLTEVENFATKNYVYYTNIVHPKCPQICSVVELERVPVTKQHQI